MSLRRTTTPVTLISLAMATLFSAQANAAIDLIAIGSLSGAGSDLSGQHQLLENGVPADILGGMGSGLAWAGGNTFLSIPDRGPNAVAWNSNLDDTASYIPRFHTVKLELSKASSGSLPYTLTPTLQATTLLYSPTALNYGAAGAGYAAGAPALNSPGKYYFSGRSDNYAAGSSTNPANARLDPEGIRVSNDGKHVYVSDEYGPYLYQFDRATGARTNTYTLPSHFAIDTLSPRKDVEFTNTIGRVTNKGMEGLAITPDGNTLVGFMQSPLLQDGGDGGRYNRIVTVDTTTGETSEYAYDNVINGKAYNSSEILALNDHQFVVLERDGKGLGDDSKAGLKQLRFVDIAGATDVSALSGADQLASHAVGTSLFLDIKAVLNAHGISDSQVPSKLEGIAFGDDLNIDGVINHTLYLANDNDFLSKAGDNKFFVFAFTDADLLKLGASFSQQQLAAAVPEPQSYALMLAGLGLITLRARRQSR